MYLASQIVEIVALILYLVAYHFKTKKKIFITTNIACVFNIIHYLLLGAFSGCITKVIAIIRNSFVIVKEGNKKLNSIIFLLIFIIIYIISGIFTYNNIYSLLPISAALIYLIFTWYGNELQVKRIAFYCYFLWIFYNICIMSYVGIAANVIALISSGIAYYNEKNK